MRKETRRGNTKQDRAWVETEHDSLPHGAADLDRPVLHNPQHYPVGVRSGTVQRRENTAIKGNGSKMTDQSAPAPAAAPSAPVVAVPPEDAGMDEELAEASEVFSSLFSTKKPKDGWAGLSSGLKSVAKGTVAGAASLIAQPIAGAQEGGVKGFFGGLATG